jgi:hypothetical protein
MVTHFDFQPSPGAGWTKGAILRGRTTSNAAHSDSLNPISN